MRQAAHLERVGHAGRRRLQFGGDVGLERHHQEVDFGLVGAAQILQQRARATHIAQNVRAVGSDDLAERVARMIVQRRPVGSHLRIGSNSSIGSVEDVQLPSALEPGDRAPADAPAAFEVEVG